MGGPCRTHFGGGIIFVMGPLSRCSSRDDRGSRAPSTVPEMSEHRQSRPIPILASDAERERCVALLRDAVGEGRLTLDEFSERVGLAHAARTDQELAHLARDLPGGPEAARLLTVASASTHEIPRSPGHGPPGPPAIRAHAVGPRSRPSRRLSTRSMRAAGEPSSSVLASASRDARMGSRALSSPSSSTTPASTSRGGSWASTSRTLSTFSGSAMRWRCHCGFSSAVLPLATKAQDANAAQKSLAATAYCDSTSAASTTEQQCA